MAFAYTEIGAGSGAGGARESAASIGEQAVEFYSFTQGTSDTSGTITTRMMKPQVAFVSPGVISTSTVIATCSATTNTVTITSQGSSGSPTSGTVMVVGKGR